MKKKRIVIISCGFVLLGSSFVYAFSIPGVTRPFDPAAYYSETEISYRDSTYTPFTMRDLARNGFRVKDVLRGKKNILSDIKTYTDFINAVKDYEKQIIDITGLPADQSNKLLTSLMSTFSITDTNNQSEVIPDIDAQDIFQTSSTVGNPTKSFDRKTQIVWLDQMYQKILASIKENMADSSQQTDALIEANNASANAEGNLAATQANTEVGGILTESILRRNALLANYTAINTAHNMAEKAEQLQSAEDMKNGMTMIITDPYKPTQQEIKQYSRPSGIGFVKFQ